MIIYFFYPEKMKTIIAVTVIFSFIAMASAQSAVCVNWANGIANCQSRLASASTNLDSSMLATSKDVLKELE